MKKFITPLLTGTLLLLGAHSALAAFHTGTIARIHYNPDYEGRNVCLITNPNIGWLCLYEKHLTEEINDLLRDAYISGKTCGFEYDGSTIRWAECYN